MVFKGRTTLMLAAVVMCLFSTVSASPNVHYSSGSRIVGGTETNIQEHPWQVSLTKYGTDFFCGGAIISESLIMTAAHCIYKRSAEDITVRSGSSKEYMGGVVSTVKRLAYHEMYERYIDDYDIGLIEINEPLQFGPGTSSIPIIDHADLFDGDLVEITGWGITNVNGDRPHTLMKITLPIYNQEECNQIYFAQVTERMFCVGDDSGEARGTCKYDEGGPVVMNGSLIGLTSWARFRCAEPPYPSVFTRIATLRDWWDNQASLTAYKIPSYSIFLHMP